MPGKMHTDDIPVPVQEPGSCKKRTAWLWVCVQGDHNAGSQLPLAFWSAYSPDRKGVHPQQHITGYEGILQADAYCGYNALYETGASPKRSAWRCPRPEHWLLAGYDADGECAAVLYSLIGTCWLNAVDPEAWLRYVICHIQDWHVNRSRELLPWKVDLTSI